MRGLEPKFPGSLVIPPPKLNLNCRKLWRYLMLSSKAVHLALY